MAWFDNPVTQYWDPPNEWGIDIGTPLGTPITAILPGRVTAEINATGRQGGEIDMASKLPDGTQVTQYVVHLDTFAPGVEPGVWVNPGQLLGTSGGQNIGGTMPAGVDYSSGPHVEYGLFLGTPWASQSIDPLPYLGLGVDAPAPAGPTGQPPVDLAGNSQSKNWLKAPTIGNPLPFLAGWMPSNWGRKFQGWFNKNMWSVGTGRQGVAQTFITQNIVALLAAALILYVLFYADQNQPQPQSSSPPPPMVVPV